jgi:hypothetical protein
VAASTQNFHFRKSYIALGVGLGVGLFDFLLIFNVVLDEFGNFQIYFTHHPSVKKSKSMTQIINNKTYSKIDNTKKKKN